MAAPRSSFPQRSQKAKTAEGGDPTAQPLHSVPAAHFCGRLLDICQAPPRKIPFNVEANLSPGLTGPLIRTIALSSVRPQAAARAVLQGSMLAGDVPAASLCLKVKQAAKRFPMHTIPKVEINEIAYVWGKSVPNIQG
ncbi:hypothetical protein F2P81_014230 [Scophthalmus maximus]|uniref:Uncharacterized protein n=1 Tax=Scophthalmus maximus TaxID=52904 RepID=A0A6A4ST01_SCOMX|nr:hypothetical protein F2P81_014230 [Scophthalmus maximus]